MSGGPAFRIEGHAIITDDGCICDSAGLMPEALKNPADWAYFQGHLDVAAIVATGRRGHEAHPNKPGRLRLVFSSGAGGAGFSRAGDVAFVDPARFDVQDAFKRLAPAGGTVAITGGTGVFDWFAARGLYSAFHLVRARGVRLAGGRPLFSTGDAPEDVLQAMGHVATERRMLDAANNIELLFFARQPEDAR